MQRFHRVNTTSSGELAMHVQTMTWITKECQFSNGEVSFDLTKLEKPKKQMSYGVTEGDYEYRIKVCSNGQSCGMLSRVALTHYDVVLSRVCVAAGSCF